MIRKIAFASAFAVLATVQVASAIITPPLAGSSANFRWFSCRVLNTDIVPHDVTIKIIQVNTGVVKQQKSVTLKPATTKVVWGGTDYIGYCEVTGIEKPIGKVTFCEEDNQGNCLAVVTVP